ncbi:hypothetical protein MYX04_12475 [Nitrospiraceae bacterium AH_259_D15_M11_P09]|nr:hypothetical protein [Nitrospiraceae bacterium AH_259_D15_M11_P09]
MTQSGRPSKKLTMVDLPKNNGQNTVEEIEKSIQALTEKRASLDAEAQATREALTRIEAERDQAAYEAYIDNNEAARERLNALEDQHRLTLLELQRREDVLRKADARLNHLQAEKQRAQRQAAVEAYNAAAVRQQALAKELDEAMNALLPRFEQWQTYALQIYQLRMNLWHSPGRTPRRLLADVMHTYMNPFAPQFFDRPSPKRTFQEASAEQRSLPSGN